MFQSYNKPQTGTGAALAMAEVIYHSIVRSVRATHGNAFIAIGMNLVQMIIMVGVFYAMFTLLGLRGAAIRGDFLLYIMSGIFLFMTHNKALGAVLGAEGPASPMMLHAPMNTVVAICSAALGALYTQVFSLVIVLYVYSAAVTPIAIDQPFPAFGMLLLAWFTGAAIGVVFLALKPWFPTFVSITSSLYKRVNMISSGKMFVANSLPTFMLQMFDWNPLFHCVDQARGYLFINYFPRNSSWEYAFWLGIVILMIGLMGEFYTRRHASLSWSARR